jgi:hypothetical protein
MGNQLNSSLQSRELFPPEYVIVQNTFDVATAFTIGFGGPLAVSYLDGFELLEESTMQRLLRLAEDFGVPQWLHF